MRTLRMFENQVGLLLKTVFSRCLVLLLGVAFFGSQYFSFISSNKAADSKNNRIAFVSAAGMGHATIRNIEPGEPTLEEELCDEAEGDSDHHIIWCDLFHVFSYETLSDTNPLKSLFEHLTLSIQSSSTASLVVLHHRWKSFLI